jgi:hypothetical protein
MRHRPAGGVPSLSSRSRPSRIRSSTEIVLSPCSLAPPCVLPVRTQVVTGLAREPEHAAPIWRHSIDLIETWKSTWFAPPEAIMDSGTGCRAGNGRSSVDGRVPPLDGRRGQPAGRKQSRGHHFLKFAQARNSWREQGRGTNRRARAGFPSEPLLYPLESLPWQSLPPPFRLGSP